MSRERLSLKFFAGVLLLVFLLLYYFTPYYSFLTNNMDKALMRLTLGLGGLLVLLDMVICNKRIPTLNVMSPLAIFFIYIVLNGLFLAEELKSIRRAVFLMALILIIVNVSFSRQFWINCLRGFTVFSSAMAFFSLVNLSLNGMMPTGYRELGLEGSGLEGVADFGNTIVAGMHYGMAFSAALFLYFTERSKKTLLLWCVLSIILSCYILLTFARTAWVACFLVFCVLSVFLYREENKVRYIAPVLSVVSIFVFFIYNYAGYEVSGRGLTRRDEIWANAWSKSLEHLWFGHGADSALEPLLISSGEIINNTHSVYLEVIYNYGIVGLGLFLFLISYTLVSLFKARKLTEYGEVAVFWMATLIACIVVMLVELNELIHTPNMLWHWLWMPVAFSAFCAKKINSIATGSNLRDVKL